MSATIVTIAGRSLLAAVHPRRGGEDCRPAALPRPYGRAPHSGAAAAAGDFAGIGRRRGDCRSRLQWRQRQPISAPLPRPQTGEAAGRRGYFAVSIGNLTGTCGEVLMILGLPSA